MCKIGSLYKAVGIISLSFGGGVLLAFFLPLYILAIIEALLIAASGFFYVFKA